MGTLNGKVAVVTGGSLGIGAGIVEKLASEGAAVVFSYARSAGPAAELAARITTAGGKAVAVKADVRSEADLAALFGKAREAFGRVDVLVNNAGVFEFAPIEAITEEHYSRQFDTNVKGLLFATREAVKAFDGKGGVVVNISSAIVEGPPPMGSVYSATKAAVDAITRSLGAELGPKGIRVVSINPGATRSEGFSAFDQSGEIAKRFVSQTPLGRLGQPEDVANAVAFVASDKASFVTSTTITVSGGIRL
jgi:3-oxoacyl-[acyl-carrier protein] reductase